MVIPSIRRFTSWLLLAGLALAAAPAAAAQISELPFDLVDVADDPLAPDDCGISLQWMAWDTTTLVEAGGVAVVDFDNDDLLDVFLPNNKSMPNKLYRNLGDGTFVDVASECGVADPDSASSAPLFFDYDHDGDLDLIVLPHLGKPTLLLGPTLKFFRNKGAAGAYAFADVTSTIGFSFAVTSKQTKYGFPGLCAGDYNQDGWSDLFCNWYSQVSVNDQWRLMRNAVNPVSGDPADPNYTPRIFVDATVGSGLEGDYLGNPWQPMFWDVNRDGWPDLHIAEDFGLDVMFINNKNGTFTNVANAVGLNGNPPENRNEMGVALGDVDYDLDHDLHTTNLGDPGLDRFYRNDSVGTTLSFTDIGVETGLNVSLWGWGTSFADLDNDADLDHADVVGISHSFAGLPYNPVQVNLFPEMLPGIGPAWAEVSALVPDFSKIDTIDGNSAHGLAAADYDNDGDMDLVITRNDGQFAGVFKNTLVSTNGWLEVDLVDTAGSLDVTGSRVYVQQGSLIQLREVFTGSSFLATEPPRLHFGLGQPRGSQDVLGSGPSTGFGGGATAGKGASGTPGAQVPMPGAGKVKRGNGPDWMVVRWPDGAAQIVLNPVRNTIHKVFRSAVDDTGDLNADGHLTALDQALLVEAVADPAAYTLAHPKSPGLVTGDVDDNGLLDAADLTAWALLPPH